MQDHEGSEFVAHEPCPSCGSRNNLARYSDGHAYCFGCQHHERGDGTAPTTQPRRKAMGLLDGEFAALPKRGLTEATCRKFGYRQGTLDGRGVQMADYLPPEGGAAVAQKLRFAGKEFSVVGSLKEAGLFGQHLWRDKGRMVVVTEGEIDAMSVSQLQDNKWPTVSVPNGAAGARKALAKSLEWLLGFDSVILFFDNDEAGREATEACTPLFPPGRCKVATMAEFKDPNEALVAGKGGAVIDAIWQAKTFRPDGIVGIGDLREEVLQPIGLGDPWPWPMLTALTYGRRNGEVYAFGAGTGVGKTDVFTQCIAHDALVLRKRCGVIYLEQPKIETAKRIAGKAVGKRFHVPDGGWTEVELVAAFDALAASDNVFLYDHFGSSDWEIVKSRVRYMVTALGVEHIYLDHLTALAAGHDDERAMLARIMSEISGMAQELAFKFHFISHLTTPSEGKPHEEGGRVQIRQFKGARDIGFWSHFMFGLERNQQAEDETERSTTTFRVLKDRFTGNSTGHTFGMTYDVTTGMLHEAPLDAAPGGSPFAPTSDDSSTAF